MGSAACFEAENGGGTRKNPGDVTRFSSYTAQITPDVT